MFQVLYADLMTSSFHFLSLSQAFGGNPRMNLLPLMPPKSWAIWRYEHETDSFPVHLQTTPTDITNTYSVLQLQLLLLQVMVQLQQL